VTLRYGAQRRRASATSFRSFFRVSVWNTQSFRQMVLGGFEFCVSCNYLHFGGVGDCFLLLCLCTQLSSRPSVYPFLFGCLLIFVFVCLLVLMLALLPNLSVFTFSQLLFSAAVVILCLCSFATSYVHDLFTFPFHLSFALFLPSSLASFFLPFFQ
jgi:hypothetical protein